MTVEFHIRARRLHHSFTRGIRCLNSLAFRGKGATYRKPHCSPNAIDKSSVQAKTRFDQRVPTSLLMDDKHERSPENLQLRGQSCRKGAFRIALPKPEGMRMPPNGDHLGSDAHPGTSQPSRHLDPIAI